MKTVIDKREIQTAADLLKYMQEAEALGYDLDTVYLHTAQLDINSVALVQSWLTDGSTVFDLALSE